MNRKVNNGVKYLSLVLTLFIKYVQGIVYACVLTLWDSSVHISVDILDFVYFDGSIIDYYFI